MASGIVEVETRLLPSSLVLSQARVRARVRDSMPSPLVLSKYSFIIFSTLVRCSSCKGGVKRASDDTLPFHSAQDKNARLTLTLTLTLPFHSIPLRTRMQMKAGDGRQF